MNQLLVRSSVLAFLFATLSVGTAFTEDAADPGVFREDFEGEFDPSRFTTKIPNKNSEVRNGALWTRGDSGGKYPPMVYLPVSGKDMVISFRYRHLAEGGWLWFFVDGDDGFGSVDHMLRVKLRRDGIQLQVDSHSKDPEHPMRQKKGRPADKVSGAYRLNEFLPLERVDLSANQWRTVVLHFSGERVEIRLDENVWVKTLNRPCFDAVKRKLLWMQQGGEKGIEIDDVVVRRLDKEPKEEKPKEESGFVSLFDGKSFEGWSHAGNWTIEDSAFFRKDRGGSLTYTAATVPDDFELRFEWKVSKGCNSGVYYRPGQVEYQILDNVDSPYGENARQAAASLFFCMAPKKDATRPVGEWNTARVICQGSVIEHWLNGERVLSFDYEDRKWAEYVELLGIRGGDLTGRGGRIWLQDHGQDVWFRNLRWRKIPEDEVITPDPDFKPMPVTGEALQKERERVARMLEAKK